MQKHEQLNDIIKPLITSIEQLPHHIKAKETVKLIKEIGNEKVIIFTEYRATQYYLEWYLHQHDITSVPFSGGFKPRSEERRVGKERRAGEQRRQDKRNERR